MSQLDEAIASLTKQMGDPGLSQEEFDQLSERVERLKQQRDNEA